MKEFFIQYWSFFAYILVALLSMIITICKKTKVNVETKIVDTPFERVIAILPDLIKEAEINGGTGSQKSNFVINRALGLFQKLVERELTYSEISEYNHKFTAAMEKILETPQKKGVIYDKEKKD